jgi:hypothetical protein
MSDIDSDERSWTVKGAVRYVTEDGSEETHDGMVIRNVLGADRQAAADMALLHYKGYLEAHGKRIARIAWIADPDVSPFDPYIDR